MSLYKEKVSTPPPVSYQRQKLYIEELELEEPMESYERDLKVFLSKYGTIIDIKILKNRELNRAAEILRLCHFQGRRERRAFAGHERQVQGPGVEAEQGSQA